MEKRRLGRTDIHVSAICLGTMTWGSQNSTAEAHAQIELALDEGVNFLDTAEMYPTTPRRDETTGRTEEIMGEWIGANPARRGDYILATKLTGEGNSAVRDGRRVTGKEIREAIEQNLRRLQTDYIDLYQLHWPNRGSYHFRRSWTFDPSKQDVGAMDEEVASILAECEKLREEGKLRHFGLSNETAWGISRYVAVAEANGFARPVSLQNEYSLLCRYFDLDLAETALREDIGLLAYSPLAAGMLSGKYAGGEIPAGSRMSLQAELNGRNNPISRAAVDAYAEVAGKHGLALNQMALAFCLARPFMTSVIIGATSETQLKSNIAAAQLDLGKDVIADIADVYRRFPVPM